LPGVPLPIYSAVTGIETEEAIRALAKQEEDNADAVFIGIVTGNWVRIRRTESRCPIPLARGEGHLEFKQSLVHTCLPHEIYVVSPLGKIFANIDPSGVKDMLGLDNNSPDIERQEYEEVQILENSSNVKLVSTYRKDGRLLQNLGRYLRVVFNIADQVDEAKFVAAHIGKTDHILFSFDDLPSDPHYERETEFPHGHTRNDEFITKFVDP
jgi:hypothetical protein